MHRLENIRQLQEVKTDNRGGQNRELQNRTQTDAKQMNTVCGDEVRRNTSIQKITHLFKNNKLHGYKKLTCLIVSVEDLSSFL